MNKYIAYLIGFNNSEWNHIDKEIEVEAFDLNEANKIAQEWCNNNSKMWTYDYYVSSVKESKK